MDYEKSDKLSEPSITLDESFPPYFSDVFTPGEVKEQLEIGKEVEGTVGSGGGAPFVGNASRTSGEGTGTQAITGVGFTPSLVRIIAVRSASDGSGYMSVGMATGASNEFCTYTSPGATAGTGITDFSTTRIIYTANGRAELQSMDTDGFTLNWTTMSANVTFGYECYP